MIDQLAISPEIRALGWVLLHSLWQGLVLFALLRLVLSWVPHQSNLRYRLAMGTLAVALFASAVTFWQCYEPSTTQEANTIYTFTASPLTPLEGTTVAVVESPSYWQQMTTTFEHQLPWLVTLWFVGFAFFLLRGVGALLFINTLRHQQQQQLGGEWDQRLEALIHQIGTSRPIRLVASKLAKTPMVIGHFKPLILFPIGLVNQLNVAQVEAILAHELAHIQRNDYLWQLIQSIIETIYYFNPAIWKISAIAKTEREHCCDDYAVALCGDPLIYAKTLVQLEELSAKNAHLSLAFANKKMPLLQRVQRIFNQSTTNNKAMEKLMSSVFVFCLFVLLFFTSMDSEPQSLWEDNLSAFPIAEAGIIPDTLPEKQAKKVIIETIDIDEDGNTTRPRKESSTSENRKYDSIKIRVEDGTIKDLEIDGTVISPSEYEQYEHLIVPPIEPPVPPAPPAPPGINAPMPPAPPSAPPAPPAPSKNGSYFYSNSASSSQRVQTSTDDNGNTIIIVGDSDPIEIIVDSEQNVIVNKSGDVTNENGRIITEEDRERALVIREEARKRAAEIREEVKETHERNLAIRDEARQRAEEMRKEAREMHEQQLIEMEQQRKEQRQDMNERIAEARAMAYDLREKIQEKSDQIIEQLEKDGYEPKSDGTYDFYLSKDKLKINGKRQAPEVYEKYRRLYQDIRGEEIDESSQQFQVEMKGIRKSS